MEENSSFYFYITKTKIGENGEMYWFATASDTLPDSFNEAMSLSLYEDFIRRYKTNKNKIYLSLAHYPSLNGKAEVGVVTDLYIDGKKLKAKGYFHQNRLGLAVYNAILKDKLENVPKEDRIRISIGFWAFEYLVGEKVWIHGVSKEPIFPAPGEIKVYTKGLLEHLAVTRRPANKRTDIHILERTEKSDMDTIITKRDDAVSIVGQENADLVDEIEREVNYNVEKSGVEANFVSKNYSVVYDALLEHVLTKFANIEEAKQEYAKLFKVLHPDGEINDDELSEKISKMLENMTPRNEISPEEPSVVWQPLNGAITLEEANKYLEETKILNNLYDSWGIFGAIASNILSKSDEELSVTEKIEALQKLLKDYEKVLTPEKLKELSTTEKSGGGNSSVPMSVSPSVEIVEEVKDEGVNDEETERLLGLLRKFMSETRDEKSSDNKEVTEILNSLVSRQKLFEENVQNAVTSIAAKLEDLARYVEKGNAVRSVQSPPKPVAKSIQFSQEDDLEPVKQSYSIRDAVRKTTFYRQGV